MAKTKMSIQYALLNMHWPLQIQQQHNNNNNLALGNMKY